MRKKQLIIFFIVAAIVIVALLILVFGKKEKGARGLALKELSLPKTNREATTRERELKPTIKELTDYPVLYPILTGDAKEILFFDKNLGKIWSLDIAAKTAKIIESAPLLDLVDASWSKDGKKVVIFTSKDNDKKEATYFNLEAKKSLKLEGKISSVAWSPRGNELVYLDSSTGDFFVLSISEQAAPKKIFSSKYSDVTLNWPQDNIITFYERPTGIVGSPLYKLNMPDGKLEKLLSRTNGLTALWSKDGNKLIFSQADSAGKSLDIKILTINEEKLSNVPKSLDLPALPEKCAWSQDGKTIYCAIPENPRTDLVMPDDYYKGKYSRDDEIWRISTETGLKEKLFSPDIILDARQLFLSSDESKLYVLNKWNDHLYEFDLSR